MVYAGDILIIGNGGCAREAARLLVQNGFSVLLAVPLRNTSKSGDTQKAPAQIPSIKINHLVSCSGQCGDFKLRFEIDDGGATCNVKCVLIATQELRRPNFEEYGLKPSDRIWSLSDIESAFSGMEAKTHFLPDGQVLLLNRWQQDTHPLVAARMLKLCLKLQQIASIQTHFVTGNLKVSTSGMEQVFQEAKASGALFLRASGRFPSLKTLSDGRVRMDYYDEVTRSKFHMTADGVIVDESLSVDPFLKEVGKALRLQSDPTGFLQQDNVRRLSNETNRRGIFVAGAGRDFISFAEMASEAKLVSLKVIDFLSALNGNVASAPSSGSDPELTVKVEPEVEPEVKIDQSACARCLTCYRLCPYGAIDMSPRMDIHPVACQSCGLCRAGCPNRAIHIDDGEFSRTLTDLLEQGIGSEQTNGNMTKIIAFCCRRSASQARRMALCMGYRLPPGMVFVEGFCGSTLSVSDLLRSFDAGADGVMVLTCHEGNCHSESGTQFAHKRVLEAARSLSFAGISDKRILYSTLASNMTHAFMQQTDAFAKKIKDLGQALPG